MISNIQAIRAVAAFAVVLFHLPDFGLQVTFGSEIRGSIVNIGAAGVDLFFVISGFIISYSYWNKPVSAQCFMYNRIVRIVPTYWIVSIFWFGILALSSAYFRENYMDVGHLIASMFFVSQFFGFGDPFILPGWTLEFEALFYLLFAVSLCFSLRLHWLNILIWLGIISLFTDSFIMLEFLLGGGVFWLYQNHGSLMISKISFLLGCVLFALAVHYNLDLSAVGSQFGIERVIVWGIPSFFLILGLTNIKQIRSKFLIFLGNASYSIYIIHAIVISIFSSVFGQQFDSNWVAILAQAGCFFSCAVIGVLFYFYVEIPVLKFLKSRIMQASK